MKMRLLVLTLLLHAAGWAQQEAQFTQYMYNTMSVNPAYAGSRGVISVFGMHRTQWIGLEGAPTTSNVSIHAPINNSKLGFGAAVSNDQIGPSVENDIAANLSYSLDIGDRYKIAFGLKGSVNLLSLDFTKLDIYNPSDPRFQNGIENEIFPNIGAGVYAYSGDSYIGLSVPNMIETRYFDRRASNESETFIAREQLHFYLMAGHVLDLNYNLKFKPSLLTKVVQGAPLQVDLSANFLWNEKFTGGLSYRWGAAVGVMAGFQINPGLSVGYAYDAETTRLANYNSGSHEFFLRFEILKSSRSKMMSPRFF